MAAMNSHIRVMNIALLRLMPEITDPITISKMINISPMLKSQVNTLPVTAVDNSIRSMVPILRAFIKAARPTSEKNAQ